MQCGSVSCGLRIPDFQWPSLMPSAPHAFARSSLLCFCLLGTDSLKKTLVKGDARPDVEFIDAKTRFEQYSETLIKLKGNIASVRQLPACGRATGGVAWICSVQPSASCRQPVSQLGLCVCAAPLDVSAHAATTSRTPPRSTLSQLRIQPLATGSPGHEHDAADQ